MTAPYNRPDGYDYSVQTLDQPGKWSTRWLGWAYDSTYVGNLADAKRLYNVLAQDSSTTVRLVRVSRYGLDDEHPVVVEVIKFKGAAK